MDVREGRKAELTGPREGLVQNVKSKGGGTVRTNVYLGDLRCGVAIRGNGKKRWGHRNEAFCFRLKELEVLKGHGACERDQN